MYRTKILDDFERIKFNELEIYIEKPLLHDGSEFLIPYEGRYKLLIDSDNISLLKMEKDLNEK